MNPAVSVTVVGGTVRSTALIPQGNDASGAVGVPKIGVGYVEAPVNNPNHYSPAGSIESVRTACVAGHGVDYDLFFVDR
jgi:hypothetical protein